MLDLDKVLDTTAHLTVEVPGGQIEVDYRVAAFTPALMESDGTISAALIATVERWDLTRGGNEIPLTDEGLKNVPMAYQRAIYRAIAGDHTPNVSASSATSAGA